ncbi:MAG TPA: ATPase P [Spirochaetota bacterium]|nr:ATPase P [Spirochaetota bacterium]HPF04956.1 ATPase P [Spirochaetota bacterium]HPJ40930.1 ATPase P [Spirochaetota bacterium]HPR37821.1 ATPase P [Spirochaetota bacterium]HRX46618.1 ATPase P [Spirochaetota bacterium]
MIEIDIPGIRKIYAEHLVLDYNGTVAEDGKLIPGVAGILNRISENLEIHVITADTFGNSASELSGIKCTLDIIGKGDQQKQKLDFIESLGPEKVISVGNGFNDLLMLKESALGITVIQKEGAAAKTLAAADIVVTSIIDALELMLNPLRLAATLRG